MKNRHLFFILIISSIIFAFIVHCLFSKPAINDWFVAEWSAGDILTYTSTVALGLLAVWQNIKFKEENDKSQDRMEKLAIKANELSVISKVIEYEKEKIFQLNAKRQNFIDACNTTNVSSDLSGIANQPSDFMKTYVKIKMDSRDSQIRLSACELLHELGLYSDDKASEISKLVYEYSKISIELVNGIRSGIDITNISEQKQKLEKEFINSMSNFTYIQENMLNEVICGDLSLEGIKEMYKFVK